MPDLISLNKQVYNWAGIDLGEYNSLLLQKSLKELVKANGLTNLRLWGKITGIEKDYYIAETQVDAAGGEAAEGMPPDFEARGTGVNSFAYYVANSPMGPWTILDDLTPADLNAARTIKVHFTGNLDKEIITNPFYFKKERHFLRA